MTHFEVLHVWLLNCASNDVITLVLLLNRGLQYEEWRKYLNHVFLDTSALMAPQDGEQLIIRDKEETWEGISFGVEIVIK